VDNSVVTVCSDLFSQKMYCGKFKAVHTIALVDLTFNNWNQIVAELLEWQAIKQNFKLAA